MSAADPQSPSVSNGTREADRAPGRDRDHDLDREARARVCELCRHMYQLGWASGTGGGFSLRQGDRIYVAPSGVPKESLAPEEIFVIDPAGRVLEAGVPSASGASGLGCATPAAGGGALKISACTPLFMHAYTLRGAGAVLHSHSPNACLASIVSGRSLRVRGLEMVKGISGGHVDVVHEVPIIDNVPYEHDLADSLAEAIRAYPESNAVLVRGHGVYTWGRDWVQTKTQAECYDYLFGMAVRLHQLGIDPAQLDRRFTPQS
jgi:methylthioribulose-1-phosphate dehydratase